MNQVMLAAALVAGALPQSQPFKVQFVRGAVGQAVQVSIDGGHVKTTFAGKLGFRDGTRSWTSVCAAVRSPISNGQYFAVRALPSSKVGGTVALAGNIVAKHFDSATTADQCAGLQLAVWEAIEDGGDHADFSRGHFQARATRNAMAYAVKYYEAIAEKGEAAFLQTGQGGGSGDDSDGGQDQISSTVS
jgi:hypothetical protein